MDDTSVFRRFFVISNLIAEIMQSLGGAMGGGMMGGGEAPESGGKVGRTTAQKYGEDPFAPKDIGRESSMPDMNEQINDSHGFP